MKSIRRFTTKKLANPTEPCLRASLADPWFSADESCHHASITEALCASVKIQADPQVVWAVLTDWSRAPEWMAGVDWVATHSSGPLREGTSLSFRVRGKDRPVEVTTHDEPRRLALTSVEGPVRTDHTYSLTPSGDATSLELVACCEARGVARLLGPLLRRAIRHNDAHQPGALQALIEA